MQVKKQQLEPDMEQQTGSKYSLQHPLVGFTRNANMQHLMDVFSHYSLGWHSSGKLTFPWLCREMMLVIRLLQTDGFFTTEKEDF